MYLLVVSFLVLLCVLLLKFKGFQGSTDPDLGGGSGAESTQQVILVYFYKLYNSSKILLDAYCRGNSRLPGVGGGGRARLLTGGPAGRSSDPLIITNLLKEYIRL